MFTQRIQLAAAVVAATLLAALSGCTNHVASDVAAMNSSNIQRVGNLYAAFQNYHEGRGPKDEAEFKGFVKSFDSRKLAMMGVDPNNVDSLFTSERDGQPFKLRYKVNGGRGSVDAVVFEQTGEAGKRQVAFTGGTVEDEDNAAYQQLLAGKGPSQPPVGPPGSRTVRGRPTGPPPGAPTGPQG
jgi:hypothetical protein